MLPRLYTFKHDEIIVGRVITNRYKKEIRIMIKDILNNQLIMTYEDLYHELKYQLLNNNAVMFEIKEQIFNFLEPNAIEGYFVKLDIDI